VRGVSEFSERSTRARKLSSVEVQENTLLSLISRLNNVHPTNLLGHAAKEQRIPHKGGSPLRRQDPH